MSNSSQVKQGTEPMNTEQAAESTQTFSLDRIVGALSSRMESGGLTTGNLAELRRISPTEPYTPALWRLLILLELGNAPEWIQQKTWERRWATLMMGMAYCNGLHDFHTPLGNALARAGWSELRFVRLMRASDDALETQIRHIAQFLASKSQAANWADMARLLFYQSGDAGENIRIAISRNYYQEQYSQNK